MKPGEEWYRWHPSEDWLLVRLGIADDDDDGADVQMVLVDGADADIDRLLMSSWLKIAAEAPR